MNARISSGDLTPGAVSTPEETSTPDAPVTRSASATLPGRRPPDSSHGTSRSRPAAIDQSNGRAEAARPGGARRRLGVEQDRVGDRGVDTNSGQIGACSDAHRFHHLPAECLPDGRDALGRFAAVQLQPVGRNRVHDRAEAGVVHVHRQRHDRGAPFDPGRQGATRSSVEVPRAPREEDQPDHVGARRKGGVEGLRRGKAADLDDGGHGAGFRTKAAAKSNGLAGTR